MTVKELIEELAKKPQDMRVLIEADADYWDIRDVYVEASQTDPTGTVFILASQGTFEPGLIK